MASRRVAGDVSDWFYNFVWCVCRPAFDLSSAPVVLHRSRARRAGAYLLAANHLSPYDVPCLIKETPRMLDFVSIVEVFRHPLAAWFFRSMNAFPLDRNRVDTATTRTILDRLARGRAVAIFPEGRVRAEADSVLRGGAFKPGVIRIAHAARVPIIPCAIVGTAAYHRFRSWLPLRRIVYGINYGDAIDPINDPAETQQRLGDAFQSLYSELMSHLMDNRQQS